MVHCLESYVLLIVHNTCHTETKRILNTELVIYCCVERLTNSCSIYVVESDSEVKHVSTRACYQSDVDSITLSDSVVLWIKPHLDSCRWKCTYMPCTALNQYTKLHMCYTLSNCIILYSLDTSACTIIALSECAI